MDNNGYEIFALVCASNIAIQEFERNSIKKWVVNDYKIKKMQKRMQRITET